MALKEQAGLESPKVLRLNGAALAYWVQGNEQGKWPVLMIQGVGVAGQAWGPQVSAAASERLCAFYDNRGIGQSSGSSKSIEELAEDALALMDRLSWPKAHVVGHSMGGAIAQRLALLDRV